MARSFFPEKWPHRRELEFASRNQFHRDQRELLFAAAARNYAAWYEATPDGFVFTVKGSRFITHMKKLKDAETPLANFFASGVLRLGEKLGPFLWQLPPNLGYHRERLEAFFRLLPRDTARRGEARARHDERLAGRAWTETDATRPLRHCLEVRHPTLSTRSSSRCYASTTSRWSSPTPRANGPSSRMRRATLSTSGCTATRNCTRADTRKRRCGVGRER